MSKKERKQMQLEDLLEHFGLGMYTFKLVLRMGALMFIDGTMLTVLTTLSILETHMYDVPTSHRHLLLVSGLVATGVGGLYWGWMSDKRGRRRIPLICCASLLYFGILDMLEEDLYWTCALRSVIGFCAGGAVVAPCYIAEMTGSRMRAKLIITLQLFSGLGVLFTSSLASVMDKPGSTAFFALVMIPIPIAAVSMISLPESVQFLQHNEDYAALFKTLQQISIENKKPFPHEKMEIECHQSRKLRGKVSMLFNSRHVLKTLVLVVTSFSAYYCYYYSLVEHSWIIKKCASSSNDSDDCLYISPKEYHIGFICAAIVETVTPCLILPVIDIFGRKKLLLVLFGCNIIAYLLSAYLSPTKGYFIAFILVFRAIVTPIIGLTTLLTVELFPAVVRACALAVCMFSTRLSIIAVGYTDEGKWILSTLSLKMICIGLSLLSMLLIAVLPETMETYIDTDR